MNDINEIYSMLDWNNDVQTQQKGIEYAKKINNIAAFSNRLFRIMIKIFGIIVPKYYVLKLMMS